MQTVVITGASAGIGRAAARAFARRGWNVALLARGAAGLEAAAAEVERAGGRALALQCDVADWRAVEDAPRPARRGAHRPGLAVAAISLNAAASAPV